MPRSDAAPLLLVFFGLTASGKSTLAEAFALAHDALCHNTDRVRKELVGLDPSTPRPDGIDQGIYTAALTTQTYQVLCKRAFHDLLAKRKRFAVLDGSYGKRADRDFLRRAAQQVNIHCCFLLCACGEAETLRRLEERRQDRAAVSDGRLEIYLYQKKVFEHPQADEVDCFELNTEKSLSELLREVEAMLERADRMELHGPPCL